VSVKMEVVVGVEEKQERKIKCLSGLISLFK
jgi:hypothetical protein